MEPAIGREVIAAGIIGAHGVTLAVLTRFEDELRRAITSCELHTHPEKIAAIAEALKAWRAHTLAWRAQNDKHLRVLEAALHAAEPTRDRKDGPGYRSQIERAVKEWE